MIRVFVASDALAVREALEAAIARVPDFELSADADSESADVAVMHLSEPDVRRSALARRVPTLVLSDSPEEISGAVLRAGARGVLPAGVGDDALIAAIRAAAAGLVVVAPQAVPALSRAVARSHWPGGKTEDDTHLTPRESDVLRLLAAGTGNKTIARKLRISEHTVKFHVASILSKLNAATRTEAVTEGIRRGLVML